MSTISKCTSDTEILKAMQGKRETFRRKKPAKNDGGEW